MFDGLLRAHILDNVDPKSLPKVQYVLARLSPGDVVAVTDAGAVSFALPLDVRVVDMFGLTDAHIAHLKPQFPKGLLGFGDAFGMGYRLRPFL